MGQSMGWGYMSWVEDLPTKMKISIKAAADAFPNEQFTTSSNILAAEVADGKPYNKQAECHLLKKKYIAIATYCVSM